MKECSKCHGLKDEKDFYKKSNGKNKSWCKDCFNRYSHERWKVRKLKAVELMGGECSNCGYRKNLAALDFHHLNPDEKEFSWGKVCKRPWKIVLKELGKCILLCKNCHAESHHPRMLMEIVENIDANANASIDKNRYRTKRSSCLIPTGVCANKLCNNNVFATKYCSRECANVSQRKVDRPSKKDLQKQLESNSIIGIGRIYGVSDNAIRKWMKSYQLS